MRRDVGQNRRYSPSNPFIAYPWHFPRNRTYKDAVSAQSVAVLGMRNGTSQSPFRPALGRQLVRAADAPLRDHGFGTSRLRQTPTTNGLTAYRMRLHLACVSSGTYGPFATSASRSRLRLPRTTRLALRASLAGSERTASIMNRHIRWLQNTLKDPASCCLPGVGRFRRPSRNDGLVVCLLSTRPWQSLWLWAMFPLYTRRCTRIP